MSRANQRWLGAAFWTVLIAAAAGWMLQANRSNAMPSSDHGQPDRGRSASPASLLAEALWLSPTRFEIADPSGSVSVGDAVFAPIAEPQRHADGADDWRQVGYVTAVRRVEGSENQVTVAMFAPDVWSDSASFTVHRNSGRLGDVLATLMPPQKRQAMQRKLAAAFQTHADAVAREMMPLVMQSLQVSVPLIDAAIGAAVTRHEAEINSLVSRYREEILRDRIVPLVREEVIPIVRQHAREPAESIGREVWNRASLFRFGWRVVYDKSPLPQRELVADEWRRFVEEEVVPIVEGHLDEITSAVENALHDLAANKRIRQEVAQVAHTIAADPQARTLFRSILREAIVDNAELRQAWTDVWTSPDARQRLGLAGARIEPILRELGDELMGTREQGIEPGFARVLRNQILAKDRAWITITPGNGDGKLPLQLTLSREFSPYPVVRLAVSDQ